jgi:hypothetical protein
MKLLATALNKFWICFQWRNEHFKARMLFFSVGKGAMSSPRYWQLREDACTPARSTLAIRILIDNICPRRSRIFKGLSHDGGQAKLADNLCASPSNTVLSNETTFNLIQPSNILKFNFVFLDFFYINLTRNSITLFMGPDYNSLVFI